MKCHNCGADIPDGHLYCDKCGAEINIVPEFEPEVENEIDTTLSSIADRLSRDDKPKVVIKYRNKDDFFEFIKKKKNVIIGSVLGILIIVLFVSIIFMSQDKTGAKYLKLAEKSRSNGNTYEAVAYLTEGNKRYPYNTDIIFRLADCYLELGSVGNAVDTLKIITDSSNYPKDSVTAAYESIISIYKQSGEYDKIAEILNEGHNESADALRKKYVPKEPEMTPGDGTYEEKVSISISSDDGSSIYYTINGDDPTKKSEAYRSEFEIDKDGEYNIKAVAINEYGVSSPIVDRTLIIEGGTAPTPEIMEPSGDYKENTMIVAISGDGCRIFYTTDGTNPTMESEEYTEPIPMPMGTSNFKFIAYNEKGNPSEIVEREYVLAYDRRVTKEQAVQRLVSKLLALDVLLDEKGSVRGGGHNEYIYDSVIEVAGAGEYYKIIEEFVRGDGTRIQTGRLFAVNTHDGTLNHLGYDTRGRFTLKTIK